MKTKIVSALGFVLVLLAILWAINFQRVLGLNLYKGQYLYVLIALATAVVFITHPLFPNRPKLSWLVDTPLALAGILASLFISFDFEVLIDQANLYDFNWVGQFLGAVVIVVLIEGVRRSAGLSLALIIIASILLAYFATSLPDAISGRPFRLDSFLYKMAYLEGNILGAPLVIVGSVVITFVFMGAVLQATGGGQFFSNLSAALFGGSRGGSAKIAVTASGLFGAISGSAVANVISTGMITIPMSRKAGYKAETAAGLEAVASTGGQLVPPVMGAAAFLMAATLKVEYSVVVLAALIPSFLYYLALYLQVDLIAARDGIKGLPKQERPNPLSELRYGWLFVMPFVVLILGLFSFAWRPEYAALIATASLFLALCVFGVRGKRPSIAHLSAAVRDTAVASVGIILIAAGAGIVIGALNTSGILFKITEAIVDIGGGNLVGLLVLAALICIVLGMGMPTVGVYALLSTLVAAPLVALGIDPIAAHLFVLYFGMMSMITPPVAIASFAAAGLAGTPPMKTALEASRLAWSAYILPFIFVANPALILNGSSLDIVLAVTRATAGVWLVTACVVGYLGQPLLPLRRALYLFLGVALLLPKTVYPESFASVIAVVTLCFAIAVLLLEHFVYKPKTVFNS
ncbi:TRAP transporter fused permease subunit [Pusillimonas sp. DMV24BSW_D]|uniref:TRAP transporter permease n=1 Tax=Neopusillimonas aestuarii TaxID=2716226 RepID=UPI001407C53B|nr:TRAP transporter fused permease subunit [Pusillimonas sp. DMV24BSW_D]QIM48441.1 TRAP transporter fused permease subunit [Pusillimonas sp. DMV24BSW_D]